MPGERAAFLVLSTIDRVPQAPAEIKRWAEQFNQQPWLRLNCGRDFLLHSKPGDFIELPDGEIVLRLGEEWPAPTYEMISAERTSEKA